MNPCVAREYIESCLKIRTKSGAVVPFRLNAAQQKLYAVAKRQQDEGKAMTFLWVHQTLKAHARWLASAAKVEVNTATAIELCRMVADPAPASSATKRFFSVCGRIRRISAP